MVELKSEVNNNVPSLFLEKDPKNIMGYVNSIDVWTDCTLLLQTLEKFINLRSATLKKFGSDTFKSQSENNTCLNTKILEIERVVFDSLVNSAQSIKKEEDKA